MLDYYKFEYCLIFGLICCIIRYLKCKRFKIFYGHDQRKCVYDEGLLCRSMKENEEKVGEIKNV